MICLKTINGNSKSAHEVIIITNYSFLITHLKLSSQPGFWIQLSRFTTKLEL